MSCFKQFQNNNNYNNNYSDILNLKCALKCYYVKCYNSYNPDLKEQGNIVLTKRSKEITLLELILAGI